MRGHNQQCSIMMRHRTRAPFMNVLGLCPEGALKHVATDLQFYKIYKSAGIKSESAHIDTRHVNCYRYWLNALSYAMSYTKAMVVSPPGHKAVGVSAFRVKYASNLFPLFFSRLGIEVTHQTLQKYSGIRRQMLVTGRYVHYTTIRGGRK
jgi:hypothetical protein